MSRLLQTLAAEVAKEVGRRGLVVWDDPKHWYSDVVSGAIPEGCRLERYEGSWFELRRRVEPLIAGAIKPKLVVYVGTKPPDSDPLEEVRQAAGRPFDIGLRSLLTLTFGGELTKERLDKVARHSRSLSDAETALEAATETDSRLIPLFATTDPIAVAVAVLTRTRDDAISQAGAWSMVGDVLSASFGLAPGSQGNDLGVRLFRHLSLASLSKLGPLPEGLSTFTAEVDPAQFKRCLEVLDRLRHPSLAGDFAVLARQFDGDLNVEAELKWTEAMTEVDTSPGVENLAFNEGLRLLASRDFSGACDLAQARLRSSIWAQPTPWNPSKAVDGDHPHRRWQALERVAHLRQLIWSSAPPKAGSAVVLRWYVDEGWKVDRAHRVAEVARAHLGHLGELDAEFVAARSEYEQWLDSAAASLTSSIGKDGFDPGSIMRQSEIYPRYLRNRGNESVAFIMVDALRLELGYAMADRLHLSSEQVQRFPAIAALPTITPVGMANLLPGADESLELTQGSTGALEVAVGGRSITSVAERLDLVRRDAGEVLDLTFTELLNQSDARLKEAIAGCGVVVVRSGDVDSAGEAGHLGTAWRSVDGVLDDLATQILRLGRLGIRKAVVVADHGFIVLSQALTSGRVLKRPAGGELHRRCWIGSGGLTPDGAVRIPLSDMGVGGGLDLVVPGRLGVFPVPGTRQFFHGGTSPQEMVIPVLVIELKGPEPSSGASVAVTVAGRGITTGVFAATLRLPASLFAAEVTVRVTARQAERQQIVGRPVAGDGLNSESGTILLTAEHPSVITFQVVSDLDAGAQVQLQVLDAHSGARLGEASVAVVAQVRVDDDL